MSPAAPVTIALDVGDARIGVAISRSGVLAEPLAVIERTGRRAVLDALDALVRQHGVQVCVVGLPLLERGVEGEQAGKTRAFARSLARRLPALRLEFQDERWSSADARAIAGGRAVQRHGEDAVAAMVILEAWIERQEKIAHREPEAPADCPNP